MENDLTGQQRAVVELPPDAKTLVTAAAGTGKTFVLTERLRHLVEVCGLGPGSEILVLSFTRSAVGVIRRRVLVAGGDVRYIKAATFDSFATRLLSEFDHDGPWPSQDYGDRILSATHLLLTSERARAHLAQYRHVLVDEIQDLVCERIQFVKTILAGSGGGFTVFGDPAQAIYNFQIDEEAKRVDSESLFGWLRRAYRGSLHELTLDRNFRALTPEVQALLWAGSELAGNEPDFARIRYRLDSAVLALPGADPLCLAARSFVAGTCSSAFLCRTNGQALLISRSLFECGVPHRMQRLGTDQVVGPWLALAFYGLRYQVVGKKVFRSRIEELGVADAGTPDPATAWDMLKRIDRRHSDDLHLPTIAAAIRTKNIPDEMTYQPEEVLTVSTIHRAKGLEFDRVVIADLRGAHPDDQLTMPEETRVLYVALTRPRSELLRLTSPDTRGLSSKTNPGGRWVRRVLKWRTTDFEVQGGDVHAADPAGAFLLKDVAVVHTQEYIAEHVSPGDALHAHLIGKALSGTPRAYYALKHHDRVVGVTSEQFSSLLYKTLKLNRSWEVQWPLEIRGLHVECVDTAAGTEAASSTSGLGVSGMWLRVRPFGLGRLVFGPQEEDHA